MKRWQCATLNGCSIERATSIAACIHSVARDGYPSTHSAQPPCIRQDTPVSRWWRNAGERIGLCTWGS